MKLTKLIKYILVGIILVVFLTNAFVVLRSAPYLYSSTEKVKESNTAIILGAAVYSSGKLSPIFEARADKAIELYQEGKVKKILVSGDNSSVSHNEVNPVKNYLIKEGIPESDIYLDHAGFDTYSTMYRARDIFHVDSAIVVTQAFHLPRSIFLARSLGLDAYGVSADNGRARVKNYVREVAANEKAILNLITGREPKYLGESIPIPEEE